ncbi:MAG TPA: hypothetical protein VFT72_06450 [Opitutaceae bacterium]|nr:hypothetical protein [Opitutaceae bacterium]
MFLVFQLPIIDVRKFLKNETLTRFPNWQRPEVGSSFLHSIGGFKRRFRGGSDDWTGEGYYCSSSRWLKFPPPTGAESRTMKLSATNSACLTPIFRRWLSDGTGLVRLEIGWRIHLPVKLEGYAAIELLKGVHKLPISIKTAEGLKTISILDLRNHAVEMYRFATTKTADKTKKPSKLQKVRELTKTVAAKKTKDWAVRAGAPLVYVDYEAREVDSLPTFAQYIQTDSAQQSGLQPALLGSEVNGREIKGWFVKRTDDPDALRQLRINLLRMYAEFESLAQLLDLNDDGRLRMKRGLDSQALHEHFVSMKEALDPPKDEADKNTAIYKLALQCQSKATNGYSVGILEKLRKYDQQASNDPEKFLRDLTNSRPVIIVKNSTDTESDGSGREGLADATNPIGFLRYAAAQLPILKWAIGVVGLVALIGIITAWHLKPAAMIFGAIAIFVGMFGLFVFSALVNPRARKAPRPPLVSQIALWFFVLLCMGASALTFTGLFFNRPIPLRDMVFGVTQEAKSGT